MNHKEIEEREIIERYVLHQLTPEERLAFQEHYFGCDECFGQTQIAARFIASVHQASRTGVFSADERESRPVQSGLMAVLFGQTWAAPALAALLLVAVTLTGFWALSLRHENQRLVSQAAEQGRASELLNAKNQELERGSNALREETESVKAENNRLKEELAKAEQQGETQLAQLGQLDVNVPVRNIYPVDDAQRGGTSEANRVHVPHGTRTLVLILSDYKAGYPDYRLEISDASGRVVAKREGLKPNQSGDLNVMLSRSLLARGNCRLKLFARQQLIAEYVILIE
jgi:hypothetical protein